MERGVVGERGRSRGHGHGHRKDTSAGVAGQGAGDSGRDPQRGQGDKGGGDAAHRLHIRLRGCPAPRPPPFAPPSPPGSRAPSCLSPGARKGSKGQGKGAVGPWGQTGRGTGATGGGRSTGRGTGGGAPPQPDVQPVRRIPPSIQQMPAHHTHHHHHHHAHPYNIDPDAGDLIRPQPPRPQHQPVPRAPRAERARMAAAPAEGGRGAAPAPQAQGPQGEPARGAEGARPWDRDWDTFPDPLGGEALPLMVEVYGSLSWACSGTSRGMRNKPFHAVLLQRDAGNWEVPPGGWAASGDHKRVLRAVIRAGWPDREPTWPAFLEGGAVLRITDTDANNWLPLGFAQRPHPLALPPAEAATGADPAPA